VPPAPPTLPAPLDAEEARTEARPWRVDARNASPAQRRSVRHTRCARTPTEPTRSCPVGTARPSTQPPSTPWHFEAPTSRARTPPGATCGSWASQTNSPTTCASRRARQRGGGTRPSVWHTWLTPATRSVPCSWLAGYLRRQPPLSCAALPPTCPASLPQHWRSVGSTRSARGCSTGSLRSAPGGPQQWGAHGWAGRRQTPRASLATPPARRGYACSGCSPAEWLASTTRTASPSRSTSGTGTRPRRCLTEP